MTFEWDERKAERNLAKHGVPLDYATRVFWTQPGWTPGTTAATMVKTGGSPWA